MEIVVSVATVAVGALLIWGVTRLWLRERRLTRAKAPLLGVVLPPEERDTEK